MSRKPLFVIGIVWIALVAAVLSCVRSGQTTQFWRVGPSGSVVKASSTAKPVSAAASTGPELTPTPDPPRVLPTARTNPQQYIVQPSDTLGKIAQRYGVSLDSLVAANKIANPDHLEVGQALVIPVTTPQAPGPAFKIIPDSELVNGPSAAKFDLAGFVKAQKGYLRSYSQDIAGRTYDGAGVVLRVATDYSVNPRLLLAILEYRGHWLTQANPPDELKTAPIQVLGTGRNDLYHQLTWTANNLNMGYYLWRVNGLATWVLQDDSIVSINPTINAGTAGVQYFFSQLFSQQDWQTAVGENGLFKTYQQLFGYPFYGAVEPLLPPGLKQPSMQLPFEKGATWSLTGGPHGGWDSGSAWAAIDFAPPGQALGCVQSNAWEVAVADGLIVRSDIGAVVQDLDGDGFEQTGWTVLYMHVETRDRVKPGTYLHAGDRIGHPSCEGGVSTGTHLHLARRYNGEWISADGPIPFNLEGWISKGDGVEYNGFLVKDGTTVEAWEGRRPENAIGR